MGRLVRTTVCAPGITVVLIALAIGACSAPANASAKRAPTVVSLTFDDAYQDQWLYGVPLLRLHGFNATFYVITSDSDVPYKCCMSWRELDTLQGQGDDIGSHTIHHPNNLTMLTNSQITQEVCGSRRDMVSNGIQNPVSFAYPDGIDNATAESIVRHCGFTNARAGGGISNSDFTPSAPYIETLPPKDPMAVRTIAVDGANPEKLADLEGFVTAAAAAAAGGGWLPITFHDVCDKAAADWSHCMSTWGAVQDTVLGQFLDWLVAAGEPGGAPAGIVVKTMRDAMTPNHMTANHKTTNHKISETHHIARISTQGKPGTDTFRLIAGGTVDGRIGATTVHGAFRSLGQLTGARSETEHGTEFDDGGSRSFVHHIKFAIINGQITTSGSGKWTGGTGAYRHARGSFKLSGGGPLGGVQTSHITGSIIC